MIKPLLLIPVMLLSCNAFAGSYTNMSYDQPTLVLTEDHLPDRSKVGAETKSSSGGGWVSKIGEIEDQFHQDLEGLIAIHKSSGRSKNGRAYAKITDSSGASVQYSGNIQYSGNVVQSSRSINRNTYDIMIESIADRHGVERGLVKAIMHTESSFNPMARSPVGAQGLMQLMPDTAKRFNVSNSYDPQQNIEGGVKYIKWLKKRFNGNLSLVLAAYNAGEGNVDKYNGIPPFKETQGYVKKVLERYHALYKHI